MSNKPAKTFREGAVGLSVWERQGSRGTFYDFALSRSYKNGDGKSAYATTFREDNAAAIVRVVNEAAAWIRERPRGRSQSEEATGVTDLQPSEVDEPTWANEAA